MPAACAVGVNGPDSGADYGRLRRGGACGAAEPVDEAGTALCARHTLEGPARHRKRRGHRTAQGVLIRSRQIRCLRKGNSVIQTLQLTAQLFLYDDRTSEETRTCSTSVSHRRHDIHAEVCTRAPGVARSPRHCRRGSRGARRRIEGQQCIALGGDPQGRALAILWLRVTDARTGQRNRLSCTGFRTTPTCEILPPDDAPLRRRKRSGRMGGAQGYRYAGGACAG